MATKFLLGFVTGAYVATQYDFKPYFDLAEHKIKKHLEDFKKEADEKKVETPQQTFDIRNLFGSTEEKKDS